MLLGVRKNLAIAEPAVIVQSRENGLDRKLVLFKPPFRQAACVVARPYWKLAVEHVEHPFELVHPDGELVASLSTFLFSPRTKHFLLLLLVDGRPILVGSVERERAHGQSGIDSVASGS